jgi:4-amino-4-deoxy-L-arabinose transferase-like glycosyltransferase
MRRVNHKLFAWVCSPLLIVSVALGLRLVWLFDYAPWYDDYRRLITDAPKPDTRSYHEVALVLLRYWNKPGQALVEMPEATLSIIIRAPGYPLIMAILYALFGVKPVWIVIVQVFASVFNCYLVILALRRISSPVGASVGGWLFALNPMLIDYTQMILTETLFVLGATLIIYLFAGFRSLPSPNFPRAGFGIGIVVALATLIRPSPLWLTPVFGIFGILARTLSAKARALWLVGYLIGVLALFLPWSVYNRVHYGSWRLTVAGELFLLDVTGQVLVKRQKPIHEMRAVLEAEAFALMRKDGLDPNRDIFERGRYYRAVSLQYIRQHLGDFAYYTLRGMFFFWRGTGEPPETGGRWINVSSPVVELWYKAYYLTYIAALGVGLWFSWGAKQQRWWVALFAVTTLYFMLSAGCLAYPRFRLQAFAFSLPVIAIGLDTVRQRLNPRAA